MDPSAEVAHMEQLERMLDQQRHRMQELGLLPKDANFDGFAFSDTASDEVVNLMKRQTPESAFETSLPERSEVPGPPSVAPATSKPVEIPGASARRAAEGATQMSRSPGNLMLSGSPPASVHLTRPPSEKVWSKLALDQLGSESTLSGGDLPLSPRCAFDRPSSSQSNRSSDMDSHKGFN